MRKLASIQEIRDIQPIPNADAIEVVTINGWQVVAKKGKFKIGDLCVYFEIDSFLPIKPEFEFLRKACYRKMADGSEGFRLKTIRLRGQISQGLALPLNYFNWYDIPNINYYNALDVFNEDQDLTDILEIKKYERSMPSIPGFAKGDFPGFIKKTDQERVQNIWYKLKQKHENTNFEVTIKLDGTSATYFYRDGELGVCSRNLNLKIDEENDLVDHGTTSSRSRNTYISCGVRAGIFEGLKKLGRNLAIQGEIIGEGIQGNPEKLIGQHLYVFDIYDIDKSRYLTHKERLGILELFDVKPNVAPIHDFRTLQYFPAIENILQYSEGRSMNAEVREGLVFKSLDLVDNDVLSFKVISNQYLLNDDAD